MCTFELCTISRRWPRKMFSFIVNNRYLAFLKHIPFLPVLFDALLMIWSSLVTPEVTDAVEEIEREVSSWAGITVSLHKFGGIQFNYHSSEIGHIHSNGILDILFSQKVKKVLLEAGAAAAHHSFAQAGWVSFQLQGQCDVQKALALLYLSYKQKVERGLMSAAH